MKCPYCTDDSTSVLESRTIGEGEGVRRRRECSKCGKRFTTHERVDRSLLWVVKKGGQKEPFDREKVKKGIMRAIEKRPVTMDQVEDILDAIERELLKKNTTEINSKVIGNIVVRKLKKVDQVAWLRFASVYMQFEDLDDFLKAVEK